MMAPLYDQHLATFRKTLQTSPMRAYRTYGLSLLYSLTPDELTREKYRLGVHPRLPHEFYNLGVILSMDGKHEEALKLYQAAEERGGDFPDLFFNLGKTYEILKQNQKAANAYQKYIDLQKNSKSEEVKAEIRDLKTQIRMLVG